MISSPQQQSSCRRPRRRPRPLDGGRKMITKTTTRQRHNRRHSSPKSAAVVARTMTMAIVVVVVALCALSFSGVDARKNALSSPREKPPTKKELRENYELNHPRPFSWAEVPDTSAFDKHVQKVAKENFEKKMNPPSVQTTPTNDDDTEWDDNIVDPDYEDDGLGSTPSLLDAFKNKKTPKVQTMSKDESPFVDVLILAPSVFLLVGLIYMWRCKYAWKENFQESPALSELNRVREAKEYALFAAYISSGYFDIGMLYWSLGGATLLLQMKYNAVYALVPPMTSLAIGVFYSMIFQKSLTGIPGVTGPPLMQRLLILATSIVLLMNMIYCEVKKTFVAQAEYWYVSAGMIVIPQAVAFYHRMSGWIQHNRDYRYKMVE